jgi:hypothetical protein
MIAQKQKSSVQFSRLADAIQSPAEVWPLMVAAAFLAPRGWRLGDGNRARRPEAAPASDGVAIAAMRDTLRSDLSRNLFRGCSSYLLRQALHLKLAGHAFA